jgi:hypothetical protein
MIPHSEREGLPRVCAFLGTAQQPHRAPASSLRELLFHADQLEGNAEKTGLMGEYAWWFATIRAGNLEQFWTDWCNAYDSLDRTEREALSNHQAFLHHNIHLLRRGSEKWPAYKILHQLAMEAGDSPWRNTATQVMQVQPEPWKWLMNLRGNPDYLQSRVVQIYDEHEGSVSGLTLWNDDTCISWNEEEIYLWKWKSGETLYRFGNPEYGNAIEQIGKISETEFFSFHRQGNVWRWKLGEAHPEREVVLSAIIERPFYEDYKPIPIKIRWNSGSMFWIRSLSTKIFFFSNLDRVTTSSSGIWGRRHS